VKVLGEDSLIGRTDQLTSGSNTFTIPTDETTPWQSSGGIQAFWENEGVAITQSKPNLETVSIRLNKLTALVPVTSELLEDASGLDSYLRKKAPEKMDYKITDAIIDGTGGGQPLGILQSASLVSVAKETSQVADTIVFANINKMWSRMAARWRQNAVWLINQDVEPQLNALNTGGVGTDHAFVPVFLPPGGLSQAPFGTLMGRPIIPTEACKTLGDKGDIILCDLNQYMTVRRTAGIRAETSVHLWFDQDMTAFRFILRVAGQPWWKSAITRANGTNTLSWAVSLDARA
jgi:HK97 family phage major capsid protein